MGGVLEAEGLREGVWERGNAVLRACDCEYERQRERDCESGSLGGRWDFGNWEGDGLMGVGRWVFKSQKQG